jgi:hypothetical protein
MVANNVVGGHYFGTGCNNFLELKEIGSVVKLVNLLPVEVSTSLNIKDCEALASEATCTVLSGKPTDKDSVPTESTVKVAPQFDYTMPAYSFTTIRIKKNDQ